MPRGEEPEYEREHPLAAPPIERSQLEQHFDGIASGIRAQFSMSAGFSPNVTGGAREWVVQQFLRQHLPGSLHIGSGHILYHDQNSRQQDVVIYKSDGLVLPIGNCGLFLPQAVVACIEVKSTLTKNEFVANVAQNFDSLRDPQPLKVLIASQLTDDHRYRGRIAKWAVEQSLNSRQLPDLTIIANVGAVIRGGALQTISEIIPDADDPSQLYKYGAYGDNVGFGKEVWAGLALLVFEIAARANGFSWPQYLHRVLPNTVARADPE